LFAPRLERLEDRTVPSTMTVLNNLDSGPGSLRATLAAAQNGDTIAFGPALTGKTITLTTGPIGVNTSVTIRGSQLAISGHDHGAILDVAAGTTVTISGLTFTHGLAATGGAIDNAGSLTLRNDTFLANWAYHGTGGGAIFNEPGASLVATHVIFSSNRATAATGSDIFGGALLNEGGALINNSIFMSNQAIGGSASDFFGGSVGGAIANTLGGKLVVTASTFTGNQAISAAGNFGAMGGAVENDAGLDQTHPSTAYLSDSTFTGNQAIGAAGGIANGGAIDNQGTGATMMVNNCTLTGNRALGGGGGDGKTMTAEGMGGGIMNVFGASLIVDNTTFTANQAVGGNGNTPQPGNLPFGPSAGAGQGGALLNGGGTVTVVGSTFTGNRAVGGSNTMGPGSFATGGAMENFGSGLTPTPGELTVLDCKLTGNVAVAGRGGPIAPGMPPTSTAFAAGGGIDTSFAGQLSVLDTTLTGNHAIGGAGGSTQMGGAAYGGGISVGFPVLFGMTDSATATLTDSTLLSNAALGGTGGPPAVWVPPPSAGAPPGFQPAGWGGEGDGGGLAVLAGSTANLVGITVQGNYARGGTGGFGGGTGTGNGGGVYMQNTPTAVTMDADTVVSKNHASNGWANDIFVLYPPVVDPI
jgi:hypothetical protein